MSFLQFDDVKRRNPCAWQGRAYRPHRASLPTPTPLGKTGASDSGAVALHGFRMSQIRRLNQYPSSPEATSINAADPNPYVEMAARNPGRFLLSIPL